MQKWNSFQKFLDWISRNLIRMSEAGNLKDHSFDENYKYVIQISQFLCTAA